MKSHPEYAITALVRNSDKGKQVTLSYPSVNTAECSLDDADLLTTEASKADVILHLASTGHLKSVETIWKALSSSPTPKHWIQVSGATCFGAAEIADEAFVYCSGSGKVFNDTAGLDEVRDVIKKHPFRAVDNCMLSVIIKLVEKAVAGENGVSGRDGLFLVGSGALVSLVDSLSPLSARFVDLGQTDNLKTFAETSKRILAVAVEKGLVKPTAEIEELNAAQINELSPHGSFLLGTNARI
ncbi:uncharacterized protein MKZ38_009865 [Zalerion maritima]|uniref:Uncharacterized protein n=1 Tax=Zalerion maritima TaxID=339359 RepID=A0AAD5RUR9_9PEZI|nr:uncharacterized protein MKZ38_009865 [Zalerion maritima]